MLPNGMVMVAGGQPTAIVEPDGFPVGSPTSSVEIYDPAGNTWAPRASMIAPRSSHTATLLDGEACTRSSANCGKVLIVGGLATEQSAELYDPTSNSSAATGPLVCSSCGNTLAATLITGSDCGQQCGKVLVVGQTTVLNGTGTRPNTAPFAQLYDPVTAAWSATATTPAVARSGHTATTLAGGRVLMVGSDKGVGVPAEIYDPDQATDAWSGAGSRPSLSDHTATRLESGRVLVAGGFDGNDSLRSADVFDPSGGGVLPRPQVLKVEPPYGSTSGGEDVTITGADFGAVAPQVFFGTTPATKVVVASPTTLVAAAPRHDAGVVEVTVKSEGGTSLTRPESRFRYVPFTGQWSATGSLTIPRYNHTATRLLDGRVLVVEGRSGSSTEIYDPVKATWSSFGHGNCAAVSPTCPASMTTSRYEPTATLLLDGRVLVAGGSGNSFGSPDSALPGRVTSPDGLAEIYDPAKGTWSATGSMVVGRVNHTATRLAGGKVLVTGGTVDAPSRGSAPTASAEIYDPASGTWTATGSMAGARVEHTATLLPRGRVLVAGGRDANSSALGSAEVYDPDLGTWLATGPMAKARRGHTATALSDGDGRVLVAGDSSDLATEIYDPAAKGGAGAWTLTDSLTDQVYGAMATLLSDGNVLLVGTGNGPRAALFDVKTASWKPEAPPTSAHVEGTVTLLESGKLLAAGGAAGAGETSAELYEPMSPRLPIVMKLDPPVAPTSGGRKITITGEHLYPTASVHFGSLELKPIETSSSSLTVLSPAAPESVVNVTVTTRNEEGTTIGTSPVTLATRFTYSAGSWAPTDSITTCRPASSSCSGRYLHTATLLPGGKVLVAGGTIDYTTPIRPDDADPMAALGSAELYDPASGAWTPTGSLAQGRWSHTATLLSGPRCGGQCGKVLVVGGQDYHGVPLTSAQLYDPADGTWHDTASLHIGRISHTATLLADGRVLVTGGDAASSFQRGDGVGSAEIYDPATLSWSPAALMRTRRVHHTATLLPDGTVLVAGGFGGGATPVRGGTPTLASADVYDPASNSWRTTGRMAIARWSHTATLLSGAACARSVPTTCGQVLVAGGSNGSYVSNSSAELYDPAAVADMDGVKVKGAWRATGALREARGGHSATLLSDGTVLVSGAGNVFFDHDLTAGPFSSAEVYDPGRGDWRYTNFMAVPRGAHTTTLLNDGRVLAAGGYRAVNDSNWASDLGESSELYVPPPAAPLLPTCPQVTIGSGQIGYAPGYSLVGVPGGTVVPAQSHLYSWFDRNSGSYSSQEPTVAVEPGHGYWAYFSCHTAVPLGLGTSSASFPLGAYHASMVGNPSGTSPATVSGHDFAARWDPSLNGGTGGYQISAYQQPQSLAVGEGTWVFSYADSTINIRGN